MVAVILNNRQLWVGNVGDSRAVLCYQDGLGKLHAEQISEDHNTKNEKEIERLVRCGLDEVRLRSSGRLGVHQNTRSIGDYSIKGGFKDHDILRLVCACSGIGERVDCLFLYNFCAFLLKSNILYMTEVRMTVFISHVQYCD